MTDDLFFELVDDLSDEDQRRIHRLWRQMSHKLATDRFAEHDVFNLVECFSACAPDCSSDEDLLDAIKEYAAEDAKSFQRIADSIDNSWQRQQRVSPN